MRSSASSVPASKWIDLTEVADMTVDFGVAVVLVFIYGFCDAIAHGRIEFPVAFMDFFEKFVSASTLQKDVKAELEQTNTVAAAAYLGTVIGKKAVEAGIEEVVFDRGGFVYHGKIKALADAAREAGLKF